MGYRFNVKITTAHGCCEGSLIANSVQQISDCMPDGVSIYETALLGPAVDTSVIDDDTLFFDLSQWVQQIEYASTMTPDLVAAEHARQACVAGLCVTLR